MEQDLSKSRGGEMVSFFLDIPILASSCTHLTLLSPVKNLGMWVRHLIYNMEDVSLCMLAVQVKGHSLAVVDSYGRRKAI